MIVSMHTDAIGRTRLFINQFRLRFGKQKARISRISNARSQHQPGKESMNTDSVQQWSVDLWTSYCSGETRVLAVAISHQSGTSDRSDHTADCTIETESLGGQLGHDD
uniref:Uncharacterized protein n=1 Tax=Anopheles culicifacies TaxID=139723 RepID=A0A182LYI7_9DIPT